MIVVADTSPLNYLIQIGHDNLLPLLFGRIVVPSGVIQEMNHVAAPAAVRGWLRHVPAWVEVRPPLHAAAPELADLGRGEREAIQLCEELHADLLLMDERKGRREAIRRGLATTGTLGVLMTAAQRRLIDAEHAYHRLLSETSFRTSAGLEAEFFRQLRNEP
jgi:predicted nucleic acid-binding protein